VTDQQPGTRRRKKASTEAHVPLVADAERLRARARREQEVAVRALLRASNALYDSSTRFVTGPRTAAAKARVARFGGRDVRDPQPEGHSPPRTASGCVVCFENRQHAAGTRRVHQPAHERARAGTRDTPRRHDLGAVCGAPRNRADAPSFRNAPDRERNAWGRAQAAEPRRHSGPGWTSAALRQPDSPGAVAK
jgi:hypothetical protein